MTGSTAFFAIQFVGISFFAGLAAYVFFSRDKRPIHRPLVVFLLLQAFQFGATALFTWQSQVGMAGMMTWSLRARVAAAFFSLPLLIHMSAFLVEGRARKRTLRISQIGYGLASAAAAISLSTTAVVAGADLLGPVGGATLEPVLGPLAYWVGGVWETLAWVSAFGLFLFGKRVRTAPGIRADVMRLSAVWIVLLLSDLFGVAVLVTEHTSVSLAFDLGNLQYLTIIGGVLILALGILRYGSPAGSPLRPAFGITALLVFAALLGLELLPLLDLTALTVLAMLVVAPMTGLLAGGILGQIHALGGSLPWSKDLLSPHQGSFTHHLGAAWEELALENLSADTKEAMRQSLKNEIGASYLVLMRGDGREGDELATYVDDSGFMRLNLRRPESAIWPLTSPSSHLASSTQLPAPVGVVLPASFGRFPSTIVVAGRRLTGGVYGQGETEKIRRFAHILAVASKALQGRSEDAQGQSLAPAETGGGLESTTAAPLHIRTLGTFEIEGRTTFEFPLRARQVLAHLLLAFPRPVAGEDLMARIWPESALKAAANNLYVAVHALRRALEPNLTHGQSSRYVLREGEFYRFASDSSILIDAWEFEEGHRWAMAQDDWSASEDQRRLMETLQLYGGRFLTDAKLELPAEVEAPRYRASRMFVDLVNVALGAAEQSGHLGLAERAVLHAIEVEPDAHDWHRILEKVRSDRRARDVRTWMAHSSRPGRS